MQNYKNLTVYKEAYTLANDIYKTIKNIKEYRLKNQLFGSSTSICANLSEFAGYDTIPQQIHKLHICIGEANETEFWIDFCKDNEILTSEEHTNYSQRIKTIQQMLHGLRKYIENKK